MQHLSRMNMSKFIVPSTRMADTPIFVPPDCGTVASATLAGPQILSSTAQMVNVSANTVSKPAVEKAVNEVATNEAVPAPNTSLSASS